MRASRKVFLAVGLSLLAGLQVVNTIVLLKPDGIRIQWPEGDSVHGLSFVASGDAWMASSSQAIAGIRVEARREGDTAAPLYFAAERAVVKGGKGTLPFALPSWTARIDLPEAGSWTLRAEASSTDGRRIVSGERKLRARAEASLYADSGFSSWSAPHLIALAVVAAAAALVAFAARKGGQSWLDRAAPYLAAAIWLNEIAYQCYWMATGGWTHTNSLMLQMCGISILLLPVCLFMDEGDPRQKLADVLYFWGIAGAIQAMLTPDIGASGFPSYRFFSFFISHGLIVVCVTALVASRSVRIDARSLLRCVIVSNVVIVPIYLINRLLVLIPPYAPGNYFMIGYPPPTGSPIDLMVSIFGPSPRYIVGLEIMALAVFALLWQPWSVAARIRARKARRAT